MFSQILVFATIALALYLFMDGRLRYDFVSLLVLLFLAISQIIKPSEAFLGFGHPAVISVVAILIISSALIKTGAMDAMVVLLNRGFKKTAFKIFGLMAMTAILSSFMNNVGALALVMPVALTIAKTERISPSYFLMPIAFASLLGGLITIIGTPPNLIISMYRTQAGLAPFAFFDFAPVGIALTILCILYTVIGGWKLIPHRKSVTPSGEMFKLEAYISEVVVTEHCLLIDKSLSDMQKLLQVELNILSIIRFKKRILVPMATERLQLHDILVIKADHEALSRLVDKTGLHLKHSHSNATGTLRIVEEENNAVMVEVVLKNESPLVGKTVVELALRNTYQINLVAISRKGTPSMYRLKDYRFRAADVLLIQAPQHQLDQIYKRLRAIPLSNRSLKFDAKDHTKNRPLAIGIFMAAIFLTAFNILPVQISFSVAAALMVVTRILSPKEFYEAIEWPVVVMLGALLPLGDALQSTGGADTIANGILTLSQHLPPFASVMVLMFSTMALTNLINNSAAAVLMAPIGLSIAVQLNVSPDPYLMGVCVAASSAFLTPIGHQSNTLIMGPGNYRFGDYWQLGLPISLIVLLIGTPMILWLWPL